MIDHWHKAAADPSEEVLVFLGFQKRSDELPQRVDSDQQSHRGKRRVELLLTFEEFTMDETIDRPHPEPWNKGKLVGPLSAKL